MKFQLLITGAVALAIAACKSPYKATDNPKPAADATASATNTTLTNKMPMPTDSATMPKTDTSTMLDSLSNALPDSVKISSRPDTAQMKTPVDTASTMLPPQLQTKSQAPAVIESVFNKQYPGATNMKWSTYDSLAAIPIDMRLTGWKKMDAEDYMVKFDLKGETYYAWYNSKGKWIGSASPMTDLDKLPAAVKTALNNAIKTRYTGYSITQVNREFETGKKSYEVELTKDDGKVRMMVSSNGKIGQIYRYKQQ